MISGPPERGKRREKSLNERDRNWTYQTPSLAKLEGTKSKNMCAKKTLKQKRKSLEIPAGRISKIGEVQQEGFKRKKGGG